MRLALLLPSLDGGGAQRQLAQLATALAARGHAVLCVTLISGGLYWEGLGAAAGVHRVAPAGKEQVG